MVENPVALARYKEALNMTMSGDNRGAEAMFRRMMQEMPDFMDEYGDPAFRKGLIRLLLAEARWSEARDLASEAEGRGAPGWYEILFARALEAAGRRAEALVSWKKFAATRPQHIEAHDAIRGKRCSEFPEPFRVILEKVPTKEFSVIFDVGANVGQSSVEYLKAFPYAQVLAFEPVPATFNLLKHNLASFGNVEFHNLAFSDRVGQTKMTSYGNSTMHRISKSDSGTTITIDLTTVKDFCTDKKISHIDFMKVDTEGHDLAVLRGCGDFLKNIDFIQCEASANAYNRFHNSFTEIFDFLTNKGFFLFDIQGMTYEWANGGYPVLRRFDPIFISSRVVGEMKNVVAE